MFRRLAAIGSLFLLVCIVGTWDNPPAEAARWVFVPHNCAEWAPIDHAERKTAILETLGVHRGQTLYCGIDQSDTFTAAEVFEAGKDHNQRDDTVYWGENGNFFGFTACQAGWLTDGEEGLTGCSTAAIFEFPRERVRDRDSGRRLSLRYGRVYEGDGPTHPDANIAATGKKYEGGETRTQTDGTVKGNTWVWTEWASGVGIIGATDTGQASTRAARAYASAKAAFVDSGYDTLEYARERARVGSINTGDSEVAPTFVGAYWECRELGYKDVRSINAWFEDEADETTTGVGTWNRRTTPGFNEGQGQNNRYDYRRRIFYNAVCWSP